jgi:hypothetical protein
MKTIELIGHVDEHHKLSIEVPTTVPPGPVRVIVELLTDKDDEQSASWAEAVAQRWADDWSDPRENIYTLDDGSPEK